MTNGEMETIRNIIARLKEPNLGCHCGSQHKEAIATLNASKCHVVSDIYLNTWVLPSLEMLLPETRNVELAVKMSRK